MGGLVTFVAFVYAYKLQHLLNSAAALFHYATKLAFLVWLCKKIHDV